MHVGTEYEHIFTLPTRIEDAALPQPLKPRKAPRQARARATCEAIVEAAARIVAERGLAGFNTNAVATRAGVSIGSLYQYFPNKDALMVALIERQQETQSRTITQAAAQLGAANLADSVHALVRAAARHHRDAPLFASAIDHEEARLPLTALIDGYARRNGALVAQVLDRFSHELGPLDSQRAARTIPAIVRTVVDAWANLDPPDLAAAESEATRAVLGYLRAGAGDLRVASRSIDAPGATAALSA